MLELVDRLLQLLVEYCAVGDDDDGVEDLALRVVVQAGQPVGEPGDRVGLAGAGRVLDQVGVPRPLVTGRGEETVDGLPLVVAREDQRLPGMLRAVAPFFLRALEVDEVAEDVEEAVALQHAFPEVGGAVAVRIGRVARAPIVAEVEGEEGRRQPRQPGGHVDLIGAGGEVDQRPALEGEKRLGGLGDWVPRRAVVLVLPDGVVDRLCEVGLQFGGGDREAVDEEDEVDAVIVVLAVAHLSHDAAADLLITLQGCRVEALRRAELAEVKAGVDVLEAAPQSAERPLLVEHLDQPLEHGLLRARAVHLLELGELSRLGVRKPAEHVLRVESSLAVVAPRVALEPAVVGQMGDEFRLEGALQVLGHDAVPAGTAARTSILPVTAAAISEARCSRSKLIACRVLSTIASIRLVSSLTALKISRCSSIGGRATRISKKAAGYGSTTGNRGRQIGPAGACTSTL